MRRPPQSNANQCNGGDGISRCLGMHQISTSNGEIGNAARRFQQTRPFLRLFLKAPSWEFADHLHLINGENSLGRVCPLNCKLKTSRIRSISNHILAACEVPGVILQVVLPVLPGSVITYDLRWMILQVLLSIKGPTTAGCWSTVRPCLLGGSSHES